MATAPPQSDATVGLSDSEAHDVVVGARGRVDALAVRGAVQVGVAAVSGLAAFLRLRFERPRVLSSLITLLGVRISSAHLCTVWRIRL